MPSDPTENTPWREGENYDEMMSKEPFDEDELDTEEAEQRITQFIMSAEKLPALPLRSLRSRSLRSCEQHCATSRSSWMGSPTTRYSLLNCCWASELADCRWATQNSGPSTRQPRYWVGLLCAARSAEQDTRLRIPIQRHNMQC